MKIAIAAEGERVSGHFGHCEGFMTYEVIDGTVKQKTFIPNPGHEKGFLPEFLNEKGVKLVIAGGMGANAQRLFSELGIAIYVGVTGVCDEVAQSYAEGTLVSTDAVCSNHEHAHTCGGH